jgi:cobalamin synthase
MTRARPFMAATAVCILVLLTVGAQPALAATSDIGRNVGEEVKLWATTLLLAVAALVAIPVLAKRDVNGGMVLAFLVVVLGGFAFAPGAVRDVITALWRSIAG